MTRIKIAYVVLLLLGVASLAFADHTRRHTGPGTGYTGYTNAHRAMLVFGYVLGLVALAQGIAGLVGWLP